jgi:trimeric autotransporter adhesin
MPADMNVAISFNLATYRGQQGFSGSVVARVSPHVWFNAGAATGTVRGSTGDRAGMTIGW